MTGIEVRNVTSPHSYGNSRAIRNHSVSVTCHPTEVTFPLLPQPKLVLDLAVIIDIDDVYFNQLIIEALFSVL